MSEWVVEPEAGIPVFICTSPLGELGSRQRPTLCLEPCSHHFYPGNAVMASQPHTLLSGWEQDLRRLERVLDWESKDFGFSRVYISDNWGTYRGQFASLGLNFVFWKMETMIDSLLSSQGCWEDQLRPCILLLIHSFIHQTSTTPLLYPRDSIRDWVYWSV